MKRVVLTAVAVAFVGSQVLMADVTGARLRNRAANPDSARTPIADTVGTGLAPTTWGFTSFYSGSLYGTGYYPFRVDGTFAGINSIYGYTYNYPSLGFVNEIRAIYVFDVSGLDGQPSPVWSGFMFDTREAPAAGVRGLSSFAGMEIVSAGGVHTLQGSSLFLDNNAANLDVYNAEDFENAAPFDNPELAYSGDNPLIGTLPVSTNVIAPLAIDVTEAVNDDLGAVAIPVPTLGEWGLGLFALTVAGLGVALARRRAAAAR